jgi:hypothetical protein
MRMTTSIRCVQLLPYKNRGPFGTTGQKPIHGASLIPSGFIVDHFAMSPAHLIVDTWTSNHQRMTPTVLLLK